MPSSPRIFYSSWFGFWFSGVGFGAVCVFLAIWQYGWTFTETQLWALALLALYLLYLIWARYHTRVVIESDRWLSNVGARNFRTDRIRIEDIEFVRRGGSWARWWGSLMMLCGAAGWLTFIREKAYDDGAIRELLLELKRVKPGIKSDPDYERFLKDAEVDGMWLSQNPATFTVIEIERQMKP